MDTLELAIVFILKTLIGQNPTSAMAIEAQSHMSAIVVAGAGPRQTDPSFGGQDAGTAGTGVATAPHFVFQSFGEQDAGTAGTGVATAPHFVFPAKKH